MTEMLEVAGQSGVDRHTSERLHKLIGVYLGILTVILAVSTLSGSSAGKKSASASRNATETYNFFLQKSSRQTAFLLSAEQLESELVLRSDLLDAAKARIENLAKRYRETIARYESDPAGGDGRKELMDRAKRFEGARNLADYREANFGLSQALLQAAIALGSASIVASSRALVGISGIIAAIGVFFMINGYFVMLHVPLD